MSVPKDKLSKAKTLVLGSYFPDSFSENIVDTLEWKGISAAHVETRPSFARGRNPRGWFARVREIERIPRLRRTLIEKPVEAVLKETSPELVIVTNGYLLPDEVHRWRRATPDAVWVLWFPDHMANLGAHTMLLAPYDHLFFKDPFIVSQFSQMTGRSVHFLPEACNPRRHKTESPFSEEEAALFRCDVAVAGNLYPFREALLDALPEEVDLKIYGNLSRYVRSERIVRSYTGKFVEGREKSLAFRGAKIALNSMHYAEIRSVNARLFEATGCGGFVLTTGTSALREFFEEDSEVVTFSSRQEMLDRVHYFLSEERDQERAAIALAGQARAHRDHTYERRLRVLFDIAAVRFEQA